MTQSSALEITDIIQSGQEKNKHRAPLRPILWPAVLSMILLWLCFTPLELAPVAWIALSPLCILLRVPVLSGRQYLLITVLGWFWAAITLQWIRLGDPAMYVALAALAFYICLYFPVFLAVTRRVIRSGIPLWLAVPLVWTSLDFLRAWLMTGFSWYYLGHSQYRWTELVQIADVTGVYGITFLLAMSSAVVSELIPENIFSRKDLPTPRTLRSRQHLTGAGVCAALVGASVVYGMVRQTDTAVTDGPVIALVQGNFSPNEKHDPQRGSRLVYMHDLLSRRAAQLQPDLIVWPETMWPVPDWIEDPSLSDDQLLDLVAAKRYAPAEDSAGILEHFRNGLETREYLVNRSQEFGVPMILGAVTRKATSRGIDEFNSAVFVHPDQGYVGRYDKMHPVIFGEYTPLRTTLPFLQTLRPPGMPELEAGARPVSFTAGGVHYAPAICFEDTVPRVIRRLVNHHNEDGLPPDVIVNLTNDAWFRASSELDQHLITASFRCIETRRPMARAVNGGISALIDSSGRIRDPDHFLLMTATGLNGEFEETTSMVDPDTGNWYRDCEAVLIGQLPLDGRSTIYLQYGDWFAMLCSGLVIALLLRSFRRPPHTATDLLR